jgi:WD40 repeat protein
MINIEFKAANSGSSINVFNFFTGEVVATLRGHTSKIRSISWLNNDSRICSVGSEGAVFYWDIFPSGTKRPESLTKPLHVSAGATFADSSKAYVALPEKIIKEFVVVPPLDTEVPKDVREIDLGHFVSTMIVDDSKKMLFVATADDDGPNAIVSFLTFPQLSSSHEKSMLHSGEITSLCLSPDGNFIFSADSDGVVFMSEIEGSSSSSRLMSGGLLSNFEFRDEVLVRKFDYEAKKLDINSLLRVIEDLNINNDHALRVKENDHKAKVRTITTESVTLLTSEKEKYSALAQEKKDMDDEFQREIVEMDDQHEHKLVQMDLKYKSKLNAELVRQKQLQDEIAAIQHRWNEENQALVESHQDYIRAVITF